MGARPGRRPRRRGTRRAPATTPRRPPRPARPRRSSPATTAEAESEAEPQAGADGAAPPPAPPPGPTRPSPTPAPAYASPAVRRLARERGVDLAARAGQRPQGPHHEGRRRGVRGRRPRRGPRPRRRARPRRPPTAAPGSGCCPGRSSTSRSSARSSGVPLSRIQKISGANLHRNWVMIPHVTHHDEADITDLEAFRKRVNEEHAKQDVKMTMVALLLKACVAALKRFPRVQRLARRRRPRAQALLPPRLRGRHAEAASSSR